MQIWWVYGPSGVGKSVVSWRVVERLGEDRATAYVDIDQLGMCYPEAADDPYGERVKGRVLAAVAPGYESAGCEHLVVSGVLDPDLFAWYADRLGPWEVRFCRLSATDDVLTARLRARGVDADWVAGAIEEAHALDAAGLDHQAVETSVIGIDRAAGEVRAALEHATAEPGIGSSDEPVEATHVGDALWIAGARAVGKSAVAFAVFRRLRDQGRTAYVDLEQLALTLGVEAGKLRTTNAAAAWRVFRDACAEHLVVSGPLESRKQREGLAEAIAPTPLRVIGLIADRAAYDERVAARAKGGPPFLAGDGLVGLDRRTQGDVAAAAIEEQLGADGSLYDLTINTSGRSVSDVSTEVLARGSR